MHPFKVPAKYEQNLCSSVSVTSTIKGSTKMSSILKNSPHKVIPNSIIQSPKRPPKLNFSTQSPTSPGFRDFYPWKWCEKTEAGIELSPTNTIGSSGSSVCGSPPTSFNVDVGSPRSRGRPRAEILPDLQKIGSASPNDIRCKICQRVFPREKSLQAHMRTHTGERPYVCDYPRCSRAFVQSGQLKTHQRLHTGEKPFICAVEECPSRFAHANRHCSQHPWATLKRDPKPISVSDILQTDENSDEVARWLTKYTERESTRHQKKSRKRTSSTSSTGNSREHAISDTPKKRNMSVRKLLQDQREKLLGAMALIELAQNTTD